MIKKLLFIALKILPLITIYKGLMSGSNKLKPMMDLGKIVFTQYELKHITHSFIEHYNNTKGDLVPESQFPSFINEHFANQYSVIAREFQGKDVDLSRDLWKKSYTITYDEIDGEVKIISSGKDGKLESKDDIEVAFNIPVKSIKKLKAATRVPSSAYEQEKKKIKFPPLGSDSALTKDFAPSDQQEINDQDADYDRTQDYYEDTPEQEKIAKETVSEEIESPESYEDQGYESEAVSEEEIEPEIEEDEDYSY